MKIFVTGHRGYIGVHLVEILKLAGHQVTGCDLRLFDGCGWESLPSADRDLIKDVRNITARDLDGHDCLMHLAALSNDPMGAVDAEITFDINRNSTIRIAKIAKEVGIPRFLFAGSCSIYGAGAGRDLDEQAPLNPLTAYAQSKIDSEKEISHLADKHFSPVFLRNATAYGHSAMLRTDLVVNNLLGSALAFGEIRIQSDGTPWRPLIHCRDISRAFLALAEAPREVVHNRAINIGANSENYQVRDIGNQVQRLIPSAKVVYTGEVGADPRNYRVNFDLLYRLLPNFKLSYDLATGMQELHRKMLEHRFSASDFEGDRFVRLRTLKKRYSLLRQLAQAAQ
jgi:nucleoside-diphosphate-sugar epimerase